MLLSELKIWNLRKNGTGGNCASGLNLILNAKARHIDHMWLVRL